MPFKLNLQKYLTLVLVFFFKNAKICEALTKELNGASW